MNRHQDNEPSKQDDDPAMDPRAVELIGAIADALGRLSLDWPVVITISGVTGEGVDSTAAIHPGNAMEKPGSLGNAEEVLDAVTRLCASHCIFAQRQAVMTASLHDIRERSPHRAIRKLLKVAEG